jgi:hypothetical protein
VPSAGNDLQDIAFDGRRLNFHLTVIIGGDDSKVEAELPASHGHAAFTTEPEYCERRLLLPG